MVIKGENPAGIAVIARVTDLKCENNPTLPDHFRCKCILTVRAVVPENVTDQAARFYESLTIIRPQSFDIERVEFHTSWTKAYELAKLDLESLGFQNLLDA